MQPRINVPYNRGFTLIELMVALFIIMVSMLAFATSMVVSLRASNATEWRDVTTRVTNQTAEALIALPFTNALLAVPSAVGSWQDYSRVTGNVAQDNAGLPDTNQTVRGTQQSFLIQWRVTYQSPDIRQIFITVTYCLPGDPNCPANLANAAYNSPHKKNNSLIVFKHKTI
jgi:prepilin-type N-terminal cleavage/methylation domain-containing protein